MAIFERDWNQICHVPMLNFMFSDFVCALLVLNCHSQVLLVKWNMKYQQFYFTLDLMLDVSLFWKVLESLSISSDFQVTCMLSLYLEAWRIENHVNMLLCLKSMQLILFCKSAAGLTLQTVIRVINREKLAYQHLFLYYTTNLLVLYSNSNAWVYLYMAFLSSNFT